MGRGWLPLPWPFWCSAERKCCTLQDGTYEDTAVYSVIQHPEPPIIHGNTSAKLDRTILCICSHAQGPNTSVQRRSPVWLSHMTALTRNVLPADATYEHADWSQNLQIAPHYEHQAPYHTCVTSAASLSSPLSIAARDVHVTSTPDLCCALLCADEHTAIIGHGKGPSAGLASSVKHDLRARRGVSRISARALCWLLCGDMNHRCLSVWKQPCCCSGSRVGCLVPFVRSRPAGLPGQFLRAFTRGCVLRVTVSVSPRRSDSKF